MCIDQLLNQIKEKERTREREMHYWGDFWLIGKSYLTRRNESGDEKLLFK